MLDLKLLVFGLVITSGVLGRDTRRGNIRHRQTEEEYKYNHPPVPENYESIPVAVFYEDQSNREVKSSKNEITPGNNVEEVSKETPTSKPTTLNYPSDTESANNEHIDTKTTTIKVVDSKPTTYRPPKEYEIPVAVVYDPETIKNQKSSRGHNRGINNRRTSQRPAPEDKGAAIEETVGSNAQVNGHTGTGSILSEAKRVNLNRRRKIPRPASEKQPVDFISTEQKNEDTPSITTSDKPEELYIKQTPTTKEIETTIQPQISSISKSIEQKNGYAASKTTTEKPEQQYITQKTQNPATKETDTTVQPHSPSILIPKQAEDFNKKQNSQRPVLEQQQTETKYPAYSDTENTHQYPKRDNSSRVREVIPIVQSENIVFSHSGNFKYSYEGGDGTKAFEAGELKTFDDETAGEAVSGGFSYTAKDGKEYSLSYTADENGYRPVGDHLPTPPPIPPAIQRALAYLATKTTPEPVTKSLAEYDQ